MLIAGRNQDMAAQDRIAIHGFLDFDFAKTVQPLGNGRREFFRHVLHDNDAGALAGSASRNSRNASVPPVEAPTQTTISVVFAIARPVGGGGMASADNFRAGTSLPGRRPPAARRRLARRACEALLTTSRMRTASSARLSLQNVPLGGRGKCDRLVLRLCLPPSGLDEPDETQIRFGMFGNIDDS